MNLRMQSQGGKKIISKVGEIPCLQDKVWVDPTGPMNVLSFVLVQAQFRVTYDNESCNFFFVHRPLGPPREFKMVADGLYLCDLLSENSSTGFMFNTETTLTDRRTSGFLPRRVKKVSTVDHLRQSMCSSDRDMSHLIRAGVVSEVSITTDDLLCMTNQIYGCSLASLKGRSTRPPSSPAETSAEPV